MLAKWHPLQQDPAGRATLCGYRLLRTVATGDYCKTEEGNMPTGWVGACLPGCGVYDERGSGLSLASSESSIDGSTTDSTLCTQPNYTIVDDVKHPRAHQPLTSLVWRRCPSSPYSAASYLSQSVALAWRIIHVYLITFRCSAQLLVALKIKSVTCGVTT